MPRYRIGVDIGGTFTDVVALDEESGTYTVFKVPTTPRQPATGFIEGVKQTLQSFGKRGTVPDVSFLVHGTTVATNALIEGKTPKTGLVVTQGFGDLLEIGRQIRPRLYDVFVDKPKPLVHRSLVVEVNERIDAEGTVLQPMDEDHVEAAAQLFHAAGVEAIAVCFLHSYRYPRHERRAGEILRGRLPNTPVSLSSEVLPEFREYPRATTTVINATLQPLVNQYLNAIEGNLEEMRASRKLYLMQSSGGVYTAQAARAKPVYMIESGPAAGVIAANYIGAAAGLRNIISLDIGGTTAKVGLIENGLPKIASEFEVGGMAAAGILQRGSGYPLKTPVLDLVEIGAGGGSIAWIDSGGALRVGPRSAGAEPGPACYGAGGTEPTLTDANLVLGRLSPEYFLGGKLPLYLAKAEGTLSRLGESIGMNALRAAEGVIQVATANMVRAIRLMTVQRGYDPRDFVLVAFGGAGPLHARILADELSIPRVLVPPSPGVTSAVGLLAADIRHDYSRTLLRPIDQLTQQEVETAYRALEKEATAALAAEGVGASHVHLLRTADLRFVGQSYELTLSCPSSTSGEPDLEALRLRFLDQHERVYGHAAKDEPIELVSVKLMGVGAVQRPVLPQVAPAGSERPTLASKGVRAVRFAASVDTRIYDRYRLQAQQRIDGPAIIEEVDSTTLVPPDHVATTDKLGNLWLDTKRAR
jgi:N-methylhydantoinase A